jgi:hypothetical protein
MKKLKSPFPIYTDRREQSVKKENFASIHSAFDFNASMLLNFHC